MKPVPNAHQPSDLIKSKYPAAVQSLSAARQVYKDLARAELPKEFKTLSQVWAGIEAAHSKLGLPAAAQSPVAPLSPKISGEKADLYEQELKAEPSRWEEYKNTLAAARLNLFSTDSEKAPHLKAALSKMTAASAARCEAAKDVAQKSALSALGRPSPDATFDPMVQPYDDFRMEACRRADLKGTLQGLDPRTRCEYHIAKSLRVQGAAAKRR